MLGNGLNVAVADPLWGNPFVQSALQLLEQFSDLGRVLPFVAPAFVVFKIIIDIERKAQDTDAKCNDLLERITFMMGHLPALRHVQVMDGTRQVIEHINDVLKTSAALIQAYRRQGPIARRLNLGNKDKFASCAAAINVCCADLMMSLQIHQTTQLDILTRSVPVDAEDLAAMTFFIHHGGVDAVKGDRQLVTQFANELHLKVDDEVMEQINANLAHVIQVNQAQLERTLNENVSTAIIGGLKDLASQFKEDEKEQVFKCVQCDQEYRESANGATSCSYHRAEYSTWNQSYPCCGTSSPCKVGYHRSSHHCDYPYGLFFERSRNILNFIDTVDEWVMVEDTNLENDKTCKATVGRLLRWVSRGYPLDEPTILITVGSIWFSEHYFFDTFTVKEFEAAARVVWVTRKTLIFRTSPSESEFAMAEWVLSLDGTITGVRLTAKAATSDKPYIRVCPIDITTCTKSGDILALSDGGLCSYNPESAYILPDTVRIGPELDDKPLRTIRTDFTTRTSSQARLPVILKVISEPSLNANPQFASYDSDTFEGVISVFNKHPAGSPNPITFASVSAYFRLLGDKDYISVKSANLIGSQLPVTIDPRQSSTLKFQVVVPRSEEDAQLQIRWWNRAFVSRHRPLRLKLVLQDMEGEECSLVLEYIFNPFPLEKPKEDDLAFFFFDDPTVWSRYSISVKGSSDGVINIGGSDIGVKSLQKAVYHTLKTGETEVDLGIGRDSGDWEWSAWALVDVSCRRVYAFKILLKQGRRASKHTFGCLGYVRCPNYGEPINETRSIRYALERVKLPDLEPFVVQEVVTDDTVDDDVVPEPATESVPAVLSTAPAAPIVVSGDLNTRLASIDSNLSRIATAVEKLVEILTKTTAR